MLACVQGPDNNQQQGGPVSSQTYTCTLRLFMLEQWRTERLPHLHIRGLALARNYLIVHANYYAITMLYNNRLRKSTNNKEHSQYLVFTESSQELNIVPVIHEQFHYI